MKLLEVKKRGFFRVALRANGRGRLRGWGSEGSNRATPASRCSQLFSDWRRYIGLQPQGLAKTWHWQICRRMAGESLLSPSVNYRLWFFNSISLWHTIPALVYVFLTELCSFVIEMSNHSLFPVSINLRHWGVKLSLIVSRGTIPHQVDGFQVKVPSG